MDDDVRGRTAEVENVRSALAHPLVVAYQEMTHHSRHDAISDLWVVGGVKDEVWRCEGG